jgi:nitrogen-specific signal transduction histidine kinase
VPDQPDRLPPVMCNVGEANEVFLNLIVNAGHAIAESGQDAQAGCIECRKHFRKHHRD